CILRLSICAFATFSPARNVFSLTAPVRKLRSFERTNAAPLPGLTCWNSITRQISLSTSIVKPVLKSFTEIIVVPPFVIKCEALSKNASSVHFPFRLSVYHLRCALRQFPVNRCPVRPSQPFPVQARFPTGTIAPGLRGPRVRCHGRLNGRTLPRSLSI